MPISTTIEFKGSVSDTVEFSGPVSTTVLLDFAKPVSALNTLKTDLQATTIWDKLDVFHVRIGLTAAEIADNQHIKNQKDGSLNTVTGNVTFDNSLGATADDNNGRISWNYNPTNDGTNYVHDNACHFAYITNNSFPTGTRHAIYADDSNEISRAEAGGIIFQRRIDLQGLQETESGIDWGTGLNLFSVRPLERLYYDKDGFQIFAKTAQGGNNVVNATYYELNDSDGGQGETGAHIAFSGCGAGLTQSEVNTFITLLDNYYTAAQ